MTARRLSLISAALLALAICGVSALRTETKHALHTQGALHDWLHLIAFAALTFLLLSATRSNLLKLLFVVSLLLFGYGTEARESRKDGWPIEARDVRTDVAGVLLGSGLSLLPLIARRHRSLPN